MASDVVFSFNPDTLEISEQLVKETFVRESLDLVHISINDEIITATPDHPFYVAKKGFVNAIELRAGDIFFTVNGEYVVVTKIQHS